MSNLLAAGLQKYYARKGNRLLFLNSMSLNELALAMWEKLGCQGFDSSVLSRVINGERLFTFKQLDVFCKVLGINTINKEDLYQSLYLDLAKRLDFANFAAHRQISEELLEMDVEKVTKARLSDALDLAVGWVDFIKESLYTEIGKTGNSKKSVRLQLLLARLLKEDAHIQLGISSIMDAKDNVFPVVTEMENLGKRLREPALVGDAFNFQGAAFYAANDYEEAVAALTYGVKLITDPREKTFLLRTLGLSYAYLGRMNEFLMVKAAALKLVNSLPANEQCGLYEGLARGSALVGQKKEASNYLLKGESTLENMEKEESEDFKIWRQLQLRRSEIEIGILYKDPNILRNIERLGNESIKASKVSGYRTYGDKIGKLLKNYYAQN